MTTDALPLLLLLSLHVAAGVLAGACVLLLLAWPLVERLRDQRDSARREVRGLVALIRAEPSEQLAAVVEVMTEERTGEDE